MTTSSRRSTAPQRISGPGELLQAIPYLLGFHPQASLVLVGLDSGVLIVTARMDLADTGADNVLAATIAALVDGGASTIVAVVYPDAGDDTLGYQFSDIDGQYLLDPDDDWLTAPDDDYFATPPTEVFGQRWSPLCRSIAAVTDQLGSSAVDVLIVAGGRYRSLLCTLEDCCPPDGTPVPDAPSAFATAATVEGMVALPDRAALAAVLDPVSPAERARLAASVEAAEHAGVAAVLAGDRPTHDRSVKRAIFAAARAASEPTWAPPPNAQLARFAVALNETAVRDAVWTAIDDRRLDGRPLWRELARRSPRPYDAAAYFLFGWASWRAGEGALANIAAERAVESDSGYSAADLLLAVLDRGIDPRSFPRLRRRR
jgi:hypothetical protein